MAQDTSYSVCEHIKREALENTIDEEIALAIGQDYRTIPTFEKGLYEHTCIRHYSLRRNELLRCRWAQYLAGLEGRVFSPFQFPDKRDIHFYNGSIRFEPSLSLHRIPDFCKKLKPGPGVDFRGQMPIPQESHMKRDIIEKDNNGGRRKVLSGKKKNGGRAK